MNTINLGTKTEEDSETGRRSLVVANVDRSSSSCSSDSTNDNKPQSGSEGSCRFETSQRRISLSPPRVETSDKTNQNESGNSVFDDVISSNNNNSVSEPERRFSQLVKYFFNYLLSTFY